MIMHSLLPNNLGSCLNRIECKTDALNPESFECEDDYPKCVDRLTISAHNSIMPSKSLSPEDLQY